MPNDLKRWMHGELVAMFKDHSNVVFVDYTGIDAEKTLALRRSVRGRSLVMQIVPNRLARRALDDLGMRGADALLKGQTAVLLGTGETKDPVSLSKAVLALAKEHSKLAIKGAFAEGKALDMAGLTRLSKTPSRPELYAKIAGLLQAPVAGIIRCTRGPAEKLARLVRDAGEKDVGRKDAPAPA